MGELCEPLSIKFMKSTLKKVKTILLLVMIISSLLSNFSYAYTYSNNSIEIEVSPTRRSYDYGDNVGIDIGITNKNRYAKLHYKIKEVYSGGGFVQLNLDSNERVIDPLSSSELEISLRDYFYRERQENTIDTHITFNNDASSGISQNDNATSGISKNNSYTSPNNSQVAGSGISKNNNANSGIEKDNDIKSGISKDNSYNSPNNDNKADSGISKKNSYYHKKHTYTIGGHAYELTEAEYDEFQRYRNEKVTGKKLGRELNDIVEQDELEKIKGNINATLLIIVIILIIAIALIVFIWFIIKSKSKGGYPSLSKFKFFSILLITTLFINLIFNVVNKERVYAADIYQENVLYNKSITTQVNYANFTCTFRVTIEYYFVNTIAPITNLELDTDSDTLPDYLEVLYLTDLNNDDTDGDGLPDGVEVYRTYTDPLRVDTDNNGVNDVDEDYDKDKLTNIEEKNYGTDYDNIDTDYDSLSDYDEVNGVKSKDGLHTYITDPLSDDTDSDGLRDDTELKLNLNPTNPSDAHTKVDQATSKEVIPSNLGKNSSVTISFYGELAGDIDENVKVRKSNDSYYNQIEGLIGNPIIIETEYSYDDGLKISYDISKYKNIANRIQLCRIEDNKIIIVEHTFISGNKLLGDVYSGEYCLIDSKKYLQDINLFIR